MKKLYIAFMFFLVNLSIIAQPVSRQRVILEIGTGTWCYYCPGAAMGADDLVENGCLVGVIEYHQSSGGSTDPYENAASIARNGYYSIPGFPTAHFDGVLEYVGGSNTQSMYSNYLPLYQQRIAIPSDFTIDIYGEHTGLNYNVQLVVNKTNGSWGNLTVQLALTESEIVYSWQGQTHLNFVERLMSPSHLGTVVDFSSTNEATIDLSFTMDASWVSGNCELIAFIQNETTKEILQGQMIPLPDLQPMQATAAFTCDDIMPCISTSVQYEDQSMGDVISWNWAFEGGNPASSTQQNPLVTYNTQGQYDVQLIVYDGEVYDTLMNPEYILVITPPLQPQTPSGATSVCQDYGTVQYSTPEVQFATTYLWSVEPAAAGTISGPDPVATFNLNPSYLGNYTIKVRADNNCGNGVWSQGLNCTAYMTPADYTLSDGAGYCEGTEGLEVTLDGSQTGVNYELFVDGVSTGQVLPGTGSALSFGNQTEQGIYSCIAFTDHCNKQQIGNCYIWVIYPPEEAAAPTGSTQECSTNTGTAYTTTGADGASSYNWTITPVEAGTVSGNDETVTIDWNDTFDGIAYISVAGVNSCFTGSYSDNLAVTVNASPVPVVSGDIDVCDWEAGHLYTTPSVEGNTYSWETYNGHITDGAGTNEVTVTWHDAGTGWIKVTETNGTCSVTTIQYTVNIADCVGIGESSDGSFSIYPNPVKDELMIQFAGQSRNSRMIVVNQLGQVICDRMTGGDQQVIINTSDYSIGVYAIRIFGENGVVEKKFIKVD